MKRVTLGAGLNESLDWKVEAGDERILWEMDFGWEKILFNDEAAFRSYALALEHFSQTLYKQFKEQTVGVCLYSGPISFSYGQLPEEVHPMDAFAGYLHRLSAFLPDEVGLFCHFDVADIKSYSEVAFLTSSDRFTYFHVTISGTDLSLDKKAEIGVCIPPSDGWSKSAKEAFDTLLGQMARARLPVRLVPEGTLNDSWDGLEKLIVLEPFITPQGRRKILGFCAAAGDVIAFSSGDLTDGTSTRIIDDLMNSAVR